jgi:hypothetical protein
MCPHMQRPGANPTIACCNTSSDSTSGQVRFENKIIFFIFVKNALAYYIRWHCSCKFGSCRIGSLLKMNDVLYVYIFWHSQRKAVKTSFKMAQIKKFPSFKRRSSCLRCETSVFSKTDFKSSEANSLQPNLKLWVTASAL